MLKFRVRQNYVSVQGSSEQLADLRKFLELPGTAKFFRRGPRLIVKVSKIQFFGWVSKRFAYGLWPQVKHYLKENNIEYRAFTKRKSIPLLTTTKLGGGIELYNDQVRGGNAWLENGGSGIVWGPAGFGKTEIACSLIRHMLNLNRVHKILFIVNGLDLLDQATERITSRLNVKVGSISGAGVDTDNVITVAAIQKLDLLVKAKNPAILKFLSEIDMLVFDEVHHGRSEQAARLSSKCSARYRLGVSARPLHISYETYSSYNLHSMKADDARVLAFLGPIVIRIPPSALIKINKLAKPNIYLYPLGYKIWRDTSREIEDMEWGKAKKKLIIQNSVIYNVTRQCAIEAAKAGETTLVIAGGSKELGFRIYSELRDANINVVYLHGGIKKDLRMASRHKLVKKRIEACVATTIYDEGIDIPNVRLLVLAYGGLSAIKNEQRLGRGLRNKAGSNEAIVIDFMNYANKHLRKHSIARLKMYLEEELYNVFLVGKNHPPHIIKLVGADKIVDKLPTRETFKRLKHGKLGQEYRNRQKDDDVGGVQGLARKQA